ncbi:MAG: hypothetical protein JSW55_15435 [Chloroflexota bacterium]|nr:MAG: hypothetical protein JSW55_15435 [Chloroflexota bacterium]
MSVEDLRFAALAILGLMAAAGLVGALVLIFAYRRIRRLDIPDDATFAETLLLTPLSIVIAIDLLDLGLDILAAPISWAILDRLGLRALRGVAAFEALLPGTQLIPTMTLCWFGARLLNTHSKGTSRRVIIQ